MSVEPTKPFDSIESAHEFVALSEESIQEAANDIRDHLRQAEAAHAERRVDTLNLALYKLTQLAAQMHKNRRALNDLRSMPAFHRTRSGRFKPFVAGDAGREGS